MLNSFLAKYGVTEAVPSVLSKHTYAIVEPLLEQDLMKLVYQNGVSDLSHAKLFAETEYRELANKGPVIVQLSPKNDAFTVLKQRFEAQPSGCFIQSIQSFETILAWARARLTAQTGQTKALLRYYEPRMLLSLLGGLEQAERAGFLAHIDSIHWFHRTWLSLDVTDLKAKADGQNSSSEHSSMLQYSGLALSSDQFKKMESIQRQWAEQGKVTHVE